MSAGARVGLVGAGPWAELVHAPVLAGTPGLDLAAVWARRPEAAATVAGRHGAVAVASMEELFERCDAVAFAVPPAVQAELAVAAARAGRAVLLEKPLAADLDGARRVVDAVGEAGVPSQVVFTWRYAESVRAFLAAVRAAEATGRRFHGGTGRFLSSGLLAGLFRTPWRVEHGPLLDLGPHVVDLLDAALGPVEEVRARGTEQAWVTLQLTHRSGAVSTATLCGHTALEPPRCGVEVYDESGVVEVDAVAAVDAATFATVGAEFARVVATGVAHELEVTHALRIQQVLESARADLTSTR